MMNWAAANKRKVEYSPALVYSLFCHKALHCSLGTMLEVDLTLLALQQDFRLESDVKKFSRSNADTRCTLLRSFDSQCSKANLPA